MLLGLEDTDIVSNPLLLVLRDALCYPRDVTDFLAQVLAGGVSVVG
jgi:hypothetical protein